MESENIKLKTLTYRRFGSIILLFRLAGIPFHIRKMSIIYAIYVRTVTICACLTYFGMFVDVYVHWNDLGRAMTNTRVLIPVTNIMWLYTYCRYITLVFTVTVLKVVIKFSTTVSVMIKTNRSVLRKRSQQKSVHS
jgi:hypothetical protein